MLFLKNTPCYQKIGVIKEEYPTEFEAEAEKFSKEDYVPTEGFFANCLAHMQDYADNFYKRESHITNRIHSRK